MNLRVLCGHLRYITHTPVRLYDTAGVLINAEDADENQEDPVAADPAFEKKLLSLRRPDIPRLYFEADGILYAVIPAGGGQSILTGPCSYQIENTKKLSRTVAEIHGLRHPEAYRLTFVPINAFLETVLLLFHTGSERQMSREELLMMSPETVNYATEAEFNAYTILFRNREGSVSHNSYAQEEREQKAIREGNLSALRESWAEVQTGMIGRLGRDEITHFRNLAVTVIALACRSAIKGGVLPETAYSLADSYVIKACDLTDHAEITKLFRSAEIHYAELVHDIQQKNIRNRYVKKCRELIHDRLHNRILISELAAELGITRSYLSQIFLREEGITLSAYITKEKIHASEYHLMRDDESLEQIAATFGFASQSHYGQAFKKVTGITPGAWREKHQNLG
mgnify:CR=1 FL=1